MIKAWNEWKSMVNFEKDVEYASFRMLPLLYINLHSNGVKDELMHRLKGIYRKSWSNNQLLFNKAAGVLKLIHKNKTPTIVMKGIALTIDVYKNFGVRPMADMDVLIPLSQSRKIISLLKKSGLIVVNKQYKRYIIFQKKFADLCHQFLWHV